mmetsp:Transcript_11940/g.17886  ORF Transcript_11940/g.17886 Transcript_11940/m.17886 type:complete len:252 (-) Transcript_11940:210-965(-)
MARVPFTAPMIDDKNEEMCGVCKEKVCKYCCPGCGKRTCSLECCQSHKKKDGCDGKRKFEYVPLQKMGLAEFSGDLELLHGAERLQFSAQKKRKNDTTQQKSGKKCPQKQRVALRHLAERKNIRLLHMPMGMSRQKLNKSFIRDSNVICWQIEFQVLDNPNRQFISNEPIAETTLIKTILQQFDLPTSAFVYLPLLPAPANNPTYYLLDIDTSLEIALTDKCIIEFPKFIISQKTSLPLVPSPILPSIPSS